MKDQILAKVLKVSLAVGSVCVLAPFVSAQGIGSTEMDNMLVSTPQRVERGAELFQQNCSVCHGKTGEGMANIQLAGADGRTFNTADFTKGEYNIAKGPIQAYNVITFGLEDALVGADVAAAEERLGGKVPTHPTFNFLQYQSRWDMVHYIRSLSPTAGRIDPEEIIAKAKDRAINGVCDEDIKSSLNEKVTPQGDEQLATGKEIFNANCASCHGQNGKSDNPVGSSLMPPARNFTTEDPKEWTNQPVNALSVFDAITNGVPGTSMASYANLGEDERWALTQYVLNWVPDSVKVDATEAQIVAACRSLSAPEAPEPISIDVAMRALIKDQAEQRAVRHAQYGAVELQAGADAKSGALTFMQSCASCHGNSGSGAATGPLGAQPPYFYLTTDRLSPAAAGGTTADFARRSYAGAHATLAGMSSAATLSKAEWSNLQAYVASFDGDVEIKVAAPKVDPEAVTPQGEVAPEGEAAPEAETE